MIDKNVGKLFLEMSEIKMKLKSELNNYELTIVFNIKKPRVFIIYTHTHAHKF